MGDSYWKLMSCYQRWTIVVMAYKNCKDFISLSQNFMWQTRNFLLEITCHGCNCYNIQYQAKKGDGVCVVKTVML